MLNSHGKCHVFCLGQPSYSVVYFTLDASEISCFLITADCKEIGNCNVLIVPLVDEGYFHFLRSELDVIRKTHPCSRPQRFSGMNTMCGHMTV